MNLTLQSFENISTAIYYYYNSNINTQSIYYLTSNFNSYESSNLNNAIITNLSNLGLNLISQQFNPNIGNNSSIFYNQILLNTELTLNWLINSHSNITGILIIGMSFGACLAAELVTSSPDINEYILISPPINYYNFSSLTNLEIHGTIILAEHDNLIPNSNLYELTTTINNNQECELNLILVNGTNHLFTNNVGSLLIIINQIYNEYITNINISNAISLN